MTKATTKSFHSDAQTLFDQAVAGLASQGWLRSAVIQRWDNREIIPAEEAAADPSIDVNTLCRYRDPDGVRRCAIGWVIPDEHYDTRFDGYDDDDEYVDEGGLTATAVNRAIHETSGAWLFDPELNAFTMSLQEAHDEGATPEDMKEKLRAVAKQYSLAVPDVLKE
jgi:hypothetical protein